MNLFAEIRALKKEGKLHNKLLIRTRILFIIATILLGVVLYNVFTRDLDVLWAIFIGVVGFFLGVFVFSQMNVVNWNEEKEVVKSGKMDKVWYIALALYIFFEIGLRTLLKEYFPLEVIPLLLSGISWTLIGRGIGTLLKIHRVYTMRHKE